MYSQCPFVSYPLVTEHNATDMDPTTKECPDHQEGQRHTSSRHAHYRTSFRSLHYD